MSNLSDESARLTFISRVLLAFVGLPIFIMGIVGNSINILAFTYLPQFNKSSTSFFLSISFVGSQIGLIAGLLPELVHQITGNDPLITDVIICKLRWSSGPGSGTLALHAICCASINQFLVTSRTVRLRQLITQRRAVYIIFFLLFFAIGTMAPQMIWRTLVTNDANRTACSTLNPMFANYNTYASIIFYSVIPIITLSIFSLLTWRNLRKNPIRQQVLQQSITRLLLAQIVMVLLTSVPNFVNQLYFYYTKFQPKSSIQIARESIMSTIYTLLGFSTHSIAFYIYMFTSKAFRQNIRLLFSRRRRQIHSTIPMKNSNEQRHMAIRLQSRT